MSDKRSNEKAGLDSIAPAAEVDSAELLKDRREVCIRHNDQVYRLIKTKRGKLILNK